MANLIPKFRGKIKNGEMKVIERDKFLRYLVQYEDKDIFVSVGRWKEVDYRSLQQNKYLHGVCYKMIEMETGHSSDEIHEVMKDKFLSEIIDFNNEKMKIRKSTTKLNKLEFIEYIEKIKDWASLKLNLIIPEPNEYLEE